MNPIYVRKANLNDLKTLLEFEQGIIKAERPLDPFLKNGPLTYYDIPKMITSQYAHLIVAVFNEEIIASGYVRIEKSKHYHKNQQHGYIGFIYVKELFRGKKISSLIMESLKDWATQKNLKELRLDVYSNNTSAIKAYEHFGFSKSLVNMRIDI
jgi:ribosomal protein S18 acetylase RimI-like enzyme